MTENTASDLLQDDKPIWFRPYRKGAQEGIFSPDEDIELWLKHNAPQTFQQLADIRYSLYHHCSRAEFTVTNIQDDSFDLIGRYSKLRVISNSARHYLLWRLRELGQENGWIGALPKTRKPRVRRVVF